MSSRMPKVEVKNIPATMAEIEAHVDTEREEKKITKKPSKKKAAEKAKAE